MSKHYLLLAAWLVVNASTIPPASACTTILLGRDATADGSTIIARNNDEHDALSVNSLYRHAKARGPYQFQQGSPGEACGTRDDRSHQTPHSALLHAGYLLPIQDDTSCLILISNTQRVYRAVQGFKESQ